jgi:predicted O-methyltransferase YrrM
MIQKDIAILSRNYKVLGDQEYLGSMGAHFEPATSALLSCLCDRDSIAIDIGANIGLTTLALAQIASAGKVIALEPVSKAFGLLGQNVAAAGLDNVLLLTLRWAT